ncbi:MAG: DMT family protein [Kiritimatiellia bacterium]|jgi:uncharacterized protein (DUF486 family)
MTLPILPKPIGTLLTVAMLVASNFFMTLAWYWHLRSKGPGGSMPLYQVILVSWGIALVEYSIAVPANRIGASAGLSVAQLKIIQEGVTIVVFLSFLMLYMGEKWNWDYLWALLCMGGAVYFVNRHNL